MSLLELANHVNVVLSSNEDVEMQEFMVYGEAEQLLHLYNYDEQSETEDAEDEPTYCYCQRPDTGEVMIQCDSCKDWFHASCAGFSEKDVAQLTDDEFNCLACKNLSLLASTVTENNSNGQMHLGNVLCSEVATPTVPTGTYANHPQKTCSVMAIGSPPPSSLTILDNSKLPADRVSQKEFLGLIRPTTKIF